MLLFDFWWMGRGGKNDRSYFGLFNYIEKNVCVYIEKKNMSPIRFSPKALLLFNK